MNYNVLIIDDEPEFHMKIRKAFNANYAFEGASTIEQMWKKLSGKEIFDLVILDLRLTGTEENIGLSLIPGIQKAHPNLPIVVATIENDPDAVIQAMELGAKGFLYKGKYDRNKWDQKFKDAIASMKANELQAKVVQLTEENERLVETVEHIEDEKYNFIGKSALVVEIKRLLVASANEPNLTVLLTGETGVGKEVAARFMHQNGPRRDKPFVGVNLSAVPHDLLESNLFGHVKGSFTGALKDTKGYFQQAEGGILLLDEIGDINHDIQIKLLRVLEERTIQPVGGDKPVKVNVQIITATHRHLPTEVEKGNFRLDLYQRIKNMTIEIPPLRERAEDISLILEHYVRVHLPNSKPLDLMSIDVWDRLQEYSWPGNIREMKHTVEYMLLRKKIGSKSLIDWDCLPMEIREYAAETPDITHHTSKQVEVRKQGTFKNRKEEQAYYDLVKIEAGLRQYNGNKSIVAEKLGFKGTDHLRARVKTCFDNFEHLFRQFPLIQQYYESIVKYI